MFRFVMALIVLLTMPVMAQVRDLPVPLPPQDPLPRLTVTVLDAAGRPAPGAEVFLNADRVGVTNRDGVYRGSYLRLVGYSLTARRLKRESPISLAGHAEGSLRGQNWNYRVWESSFDPVNPGASRLAAGHPSAITLRLTRSVIGVHLVASIEWDATEERIENIRNSFVGASRYLFNATDGQFFLEQVELHDNADRWNDCDVRVYGNITGRANVGRAGALIWPGYYERMNMTRDVHDTVLAHEFGHYGLGVYDEYLTGNRDVRCSFALHDESAPFGRGHPKASCMMWKQDVAAKICSNHPDNRHVYGLPQAANCWSKLEEHFESINGIDLRNPEQQAGGIPGMVTAPRWLGPIVVNRSRNLPGLTPHPGIFTGDRGNAHHVWLQQRDGREIYLGHTTVLVRDNPWFGETTDFDEAGRLVVEGTHAGDVLVFGRWPHFRRAEVGALDSRLASSVLLARDVEAVTAGLVASFGAAGQVRLWSTVPLQGAPGVALQRSGSDKLDPVVMRDEKGGELWAGELPPMGPGERAILVLSAAARDGGRVEQRINLAMSELAPGGTGCVGGSSYGGEMVVTTPANGKPAPCLIAALGVPPPPGTVSGPFTVATDGSIEWVTFRLPEGTRLQPGAVRIESQVEGDVWKPLESIEDPEQCLVHARVQGPGTFALVLASAPVPEDKAPVPEEKVPVPEEKVPVPDAPSQEPDPPAPMAVLEARPMGYGSVEIVGRAAPGREVVFYLFDATGQLAALSEPLPGGEVRWTFSELAPGPYTVRLVAADKSEESASFPVDVPGK